MNPKMVEDIDIDNKEFLNAWELITNTHQSVFLTGKAGTGKSTFLRYICSNTNKKYVVLAPTGIAAVNVGGMTLHSFFKIPFKPLLPDDKDFSPSQIRKTLKYSREKVKIIKEIDLIIIDEISMVRADIMDFIDKVLRIYSGNMREPFGGKQLLLVGDIFQLEPVVTNDMKELLRRSYNQFFFFNAYVFKSVNIVPIELRKIYRQTNEQFISMLDRIRINKATRADLSIINNRLVPDYKEDKNDFSITLATRRDVVDVINEEHLNELDCAEFIYQGEISGTFPTQNLPTSQELTVKQGAQVLFIKNDKDQRWINGTIGKVAHLTPENITIELENGEQYTIEPDIWENMQYTYDEKEKRVKEKILGTFKQFPIKLAWALTVHKSQGLTFNKVIMDFSGGAFSSGQTYVALSRCTTLEGIILRQAIRERDIIVNPAIVEFSHNFNNQILIDSAIKHSEAEQYYRSSIRSYEQGDYRSAVTQFVKGVHAQDVLDKEEIQRLISLKLRAGDKLKTQLAELQKRFDIQSQMLKNLASEYVSMGKASLEYPAVARESQISYNGNPDEIEIKSALANFNKALAIWGECIQALIEKGKLYASMGETAEARKLFVQAIAIDKNDYEANYRLGDTYLDERDYANAIKSYKRSLRIDRYNEIAYIRIIKIYKAIGMEDLAEDQQEALEKIRRHNRGKKGNKKGD